MDIAMIHEQVLYNQVRVKTAKAGGSGTVIYSRPAPYDSARYHTYGLTCYHVISEAITVKTEWDPRVGRERKREFRQLVGVEFFDWSNIPHGHRPLTYSTDAEIVAYDKDHDMALLLLRTVKQAPGIATLLPPGRETELRIGSAVIAVGCALLHDPILTQGIITHMGDEIDYKLYWMSNASIVFGNSGGAIFTPAMLENNLTYAFVGIPSRIDIAGWGTPITHLGYFSPITRVYDFLNDQLYHFLIPGHGHTETDCEEERRKRKEQEERRLLMEMPRESER